MSYSAGETLLLTVVKTCTGFSANNSTQGNYKVLNSGKDDNYAVLHIGNSSFEFETFKQYQARWNTIVEVWQRYTDDGTTLTNLYTHIQNLMTGIQAAIILGDTTGTVINANAIELGDIEEMWARGGGPGWLRVKMKIQWTEEYSI
jgi:hypothetical protein